MAIPTPEAGLVISYAYLWHHEHQAGREEGQKDRPSVIVLAGEREADDAHHRHGAADHAQRSG